MTAKVDQPQTFSSDSGSVHPGRALKRRAWYLAILQLAALLLVTVLLEIFDVDRRVAAHFYRPVDGWYLAKSPIWAWLYAYGTIPGLILTLGALSVFLVGFYMQRLKFWRKPCLLVVLTTIIAAGLLVNAVLKQYWGRPRPDQTIEFGGNWDYRPVFPPGPPGKGASFPCGHCTMGFVFLALAGFRRQSKWLAVGGVAGGMVLGMLLSAARIVQGAHFLSDTIWSFGIVTLTISILAGYLAPFNGPVRQTSQAPVNRRRRIRVVTAAVIGALIMAGGFLTRRPYYNTMVYELPMEPIPKAVRIRINVEPERVAVRYADQSVGQLQVDAHGFGWLKFDYRMGYDTHREGRYLNVVLVVKARSYFAELDHALTLTLPRSTENKVAVLVNDQPPGGLRP